MRICNLCRKLIGPNAPVHALSGNHGACEVQRDHIPDWQRLLGQMLVDLPANQVEQPVDLRKRGKWPESTTAPDRC